jgi:hypothetical protein
MRSVIVGVVSLIVALVVTAGSASASQDPTGEPRDEDFVTGSATLDACIFPPSGGCFLAFFDAHSGPLGQNATGTASVGSRSSVTFGSVTCLTVSGSRAVVGGDLFDNGLSGFLIVVEDNARSGAPDRVAVFPMTLPEPPTACPVPADLAAGLESWLSVIAGDLVVHDAPARLTKKKQCKEGGWRDFGFRNQGRCVAFVKRGATPTPP